MDGKRLTWIELSTSNLLHQIDVFARLASRALLVPVIKANAYGHGMDQILSILKKNKKIYAFAVANLNEALIAQESTTKPIYILSYWHADTTAITHAVRKKVIFPIYEEAHARILNTIARKIQKKITVALKIDVGTQRLGIRAEDYRRIASFFKYPYLRIESIFSHFADSENRNQDFTLQQEKLFFDTCKKIYSNEQINRHIACTAATLQNRLYHHDLIRIGIGTYGLWPSNDIKKLAQKKRISFKPVLSWKTRVMHIKIVRKGETIGYGRSYQAVRTTRLAILPVGYADGYDRSLSNSAFVLLHGLRCPVRGRICMNLIMVEVPPSMRIQLGDEAVLIGQQKKQQITADELAVYANTINYEIVTRINAALPRILTQ